VWLVGSRAGAKAATLRDAVKPDFETMGGQSTQWRDAAILSTDDCRNTNGLLQFLIPDRADPIHKVFRLAKALLSGSNPGNNRAGMEEPYQLVTPLASNMREEK